MKKSKLIVPAALAVMLLSTAASVTGTVAWFTANKTVSISASQFEVTSTDGNLDVTLAGIANCDVDSENAKKIVMTSNTKLTDASVDLRINNSAYVYTDDARDDGLQPNTFNSVASPYASGTAGIVLCVSWSMTFNYTFSGNTTPVNLFFDTAASNTAQATSDTGALETGKGFRIGMSSSSDVIIWADQNTKENCNYIYNNGTANVMKDAQTDSNKPTYNASTGKVATDANYNAYTLATTTSRASEHINLVDSSVSLTKAEDGDTNQNQRGDYLGQFTNSGGTGTVVVYCYAWFEGTDPYVVSKSVMNTMVANMTFYTRKNA